MGSLNASVRNIFLGALLLLSFFGSLPILPAFADAAPLADSYSRGMTLFLAKQYADALPWFAKAVREQPDNAKAYYCLGYCQLKMGDKKDAVLNFYISNDKTSYPSLKIYVDQVKATLPPVDQNWVDNQLLSDTGSSAPQPILLAPFASYQGKVEGFGFRMDTSYIFINLSDFNTILSSMQYFAGVYQASATSITFSYSVPSTGVMPELEPYITMGDSLELGLSISYLLVSPVTYNYDSPSLNYFNHWTYNLDAWDFGLNVRWHPWKSRNGGFDFYVEPGVGFMPVDLSFEQNYQNAGYALPTDDYGAYTSSWVVAPSIKAGMAFKINTNIAVSLSAGYQYAQASGFNGTNWDKNANFLNGTAGTLQVYKDPSNGQSQTIFVPNSQYLLSYFHETQTTLSNSRPIVVDLSGFRGAAEVSFLF